MNKLPNIIISVVALAAVIAVGLVFYNERIANQEEPILDAEGNPIEWVKYENKELGFSFEYPKNFILFENEFDYSLIKSIPESEIPLTDVSLKNYNEAKEVVASMSVHVYKNPKELSAKEWLMEVETTEKEIIENYPIVEVAGIKGLKSIVLPIKGESRAWSIELPKNKKIYSIIFVTKDPKRDQATFDRFLDSLRIE